MQKIILFLLLFVTITVTAQVNPSATVQGNRSYVGNVYFSKPILFPSSVTLSHTDVSHFKTAYNWGNHAGLYYEIADTASKILSWTRAASTYQAKGSYLTNSLFTTNGLMKRTGSGTYSIITDNSTNWNTAYTRSMDTISLGSVAILIEDSTSTYPTVYQVGLKADKASPTITGRITLSSTLTGNYIISNGGSSLTHSSGSEGYYNSLFGFETGYSLTTGYSNTSAGYQALKYATTGDENTAIGNKSLVLSTTGDYSTAVGSQALYNNTTGNYNTAIGYQAGFSNQTGLRNVFIGPRAGYYETGSDKLYIDNTPRSDISDGAAKALVYAEFNALTENQQFKVNANLTVREAFIQVTDTLSVATGARVDNVSTGVLIVTGRGGSQDISINPQILAGTNGQVLELIGGSDTNTLKIDDGNGVVTSGGASRTLGLGDVLRLRYISAIGSWVEISWSDN